MEICNRCGKDYDASMDFVEDSETMEALMFFLGVDESSPYCSDCLWELDKNLEEATILWKLKVNMIRSK